jgi:hypothetical protein
MDESQSLAIIISSKSRYLSEYRKYQRMQSKMISASRMTPFERAWIAHEGNSSGVLEIKPSLPEHPCFAMQPVGQDACISAVNARGRLRADGAVAGRLG